VWVLGDGWWFHVASFIVATTHVEGRLGMGAMCMRGVLIGRGVLLCHPVIHAFIHSFASDDFHQEQLPACLLLRATLSHSVEMLWELCLALCIAFAYPLAVAKVDKT
jgi:hypothetical protein